MAKETKYSLCFWCKPRCRLKVEVEDNRLVKIARSPIKACPRKYCSDLERFYHPDRLNYPLKRVGEKGENKWQKITWDAQTCRRKRGKQVAEDHLGRGTG
ncbi:MAG: hypothetical protein JRI43_06775 [Deltaproteobacteria bacterium]|nr:hypothetical protein [Deltaproteobacteria bacterium]